MRVNSAMTFGAILLATVGASAQPISGLYIGGGVGYNHRADFQANFTDLIGNTASTTNRLGGGYAAAGSIGWGFGNGVRAELEVSYRFNQGLRGTNTEGAYFRQYGLFANALYDIDMARVTLPGGVRATPYLGVGAGYIWSGVDRAGGGAGWNVQGRFGYQGILGIAWGLDSVLPGLALTTEYRHSRSLATTLNRPNGVMNVRFVNANHSVMLGLRYAFNAPAPAPVSVPTQPAMASVVRTYLVFFDFNSSALTDRTRQILSEAAANSRRLNATRIEIAAHADTTGSVQYNQTLSRRRGEAVMAELARNNVPREHMNMVAFGEARPMVPTADGVNEPQNRRVEIVLR